MRESADCAFAKSVESICNREEPAHFLAGMSPRLVMILLVLLGHRDDLLDGDD